MKIMSMKFNVATPQASPLQYQIYVATLKEALQGFQEFRGMQPSRCRKYSDNMYLNNMQKVEVREEIARSQRVCLVVVLRMFPPPE